MTPSSTPELTAQPGSREDVDEGQTIRRSSASEVHAAVSARRARRRKQALGAAALIVIMLGFGAGFGVAWFQRHAGRGGASVGALIVISRPPGARVEVDNQALAEPTPAVASGLTAGPHTVRVLAEGHEPIVQPVTINARERAVVEVSLPPRMRQIELRTTPPGANVTVDRRLTNGTTPMFLSLPVDDFHQIHVDRPGYEPRDYSLKPDMRDNVLALELEYQTRPRVCLRVASTISAEVWIDDVPTSMWTPTPDIRLASGTHRIQLKDEVGGARSKPATVAVKQGETAILTLDEGSQ